MARSKKSTKVAKTAAPKAKNSTPKKVVVKEADTIIVASPPIPKKPSAAAAAETAVAKAISNSPYQLSRPQTLKACAALKAHVTAKAASSTAKLNLLEDPEDPASSAVTIWLVLTTKKYISDARKLKPTPIKLPHALLSPETTTACLIVKDPQRHYKDLVAEAGLQNTVTKVVGLKKLQSKFKSFESRRQLADSHDVFLADERIVTYLPAVLGKAVYKRTAKVPIPINLKDNENPAKMKKEVVKALSSTYLHLAASASTSVRVALSSFSADDIAENVHAAIDILTDKKIPGGWRNLKSVHIKSPESAALPIWLAQDLYSDEDVLQPGEAEAAEQKKIKEKEIRTERKKTKLKERKNKRKSLADADPAFLQSPRAKKKKIEKAEVVEQSTLVDEDTEVVVPKDVEETMEDAAAQESESESEPEPEIKVEKKPAPKKSTTTTTPKKSTILTKTAASASPAPVASASSDKPKTRAASAKEKKEEPITRSKSKSGGKKKEEPITRSKSKSGGKKKSKA